MALSYPIYTIKLNLKLEIFVVVEKSNPSITAKTKLRIRLTVISPVMKHKESVLYDNDNNY